MQKGTPPPLPLRALPRPPPPVRPARARVPLSGRHSGRGRAGGQAADRGGRSVWRPSYAAPRPLPPPPSLTRVSVATVVANVAPPTFRVTMEEGDHGSQGEGGRVMPARGRAACFGGGWRSCPLARGRWGNGARLRPPACAKPGGRGGVGCVFFWGGVGSVFSVPSLDLFVAPSALRSLPHASPPPPRHPPDTHHQTHTSAPPPTPSTMAAAGGAADPHAPYTFASEYEFPVPSDLTALLLFR